MILSDTHRIYRLLRPYFFEAVNGMTDYLNNSNNARRDKARLVSTMTVPMLRDGTQLQAWAIANGLPEAPAGLDTTGYYCFLCQQVMISMNTVTQTEQGE